MIQQERHIFKGILRDLSASKFSAEFAYDAYNIRLTARDNNTLLSVTNEKGTREMTVYGIPEHITLSEHIIIMGYTTLNDFLVLFIRYYYKTERMTTYYNAILRLEFINLSEQFNHFVTVLLYDDKKETEQEDKGLGFIETYPIEALSVYEGEDIQKVYWVDGINPTRMINIMADEKTRNKWNRSSFDFLSNLKLKEEINIDYDKTIAGQFPIGVTLYAFTYYNLYGSESNIFYTSPLFYNSLLDRGGSPEEKAIGGYEIKIKSIDDNFDYLRCYSITRTSENATPIIKIVLDFSINDNYYDYPIKDTLTNSSSEYTFNKTPDDIITIYNEFIEKVNINDFSNSIISSTAAEYIIEYKIPSDYIMYIKGFGDYSTIIVSGENTTIKVKRRFSDLNFGKCTIYNYYTSNGTESKLKPIKFIDNNTLGEIVDSTLLLYIGRNDIIPYTITLKDNTLFLGNIKLKKDYISDSMLKLIKENSNITFNYRTIVESNDINNYKINLDKSSRYIKHFKGGEIYRIGILFKDNKGVYTQPVWLGDYKNNLYPSKDKRPYIKCQITIPNDFDSSYKKCRLVMALPLESDKSIIALGILCPTVFNAADRTTNSPFAQSSWFTRPIGHITGNGIAMYEDVKEELYFFNATNDIWKNSVEGSSEGILETQRDSLSRIRITLYKKNGAIYYKVTVLSLKKAKEILSKFIKEDIIIPTGTHTFPVTFIGNIGEVDLSGYSSYFKIDSNIVTFHSPDISNQYDSLQFKLRILGYLTINSVKNNYDTTWNYGESIDLDLLKFDLSLNFYGFYYGITPFTHSKATENAGNYALYPWQKEGEIWSGAGTIKRNNIINNLYYDNVKYFSSPWEAYRENSTTLKGITPIRYFNSDNVSSLIIPTPENCLYTKTPLVYYGNVDRVITPKEAYKFKANKVSAITSDNPFVILPVYSSATVYSPISMKYKSSPHYVFAFNWSDLFIMQGLPNSYSEFNKDSLYNKVPIWSENNGKDIQYQCSEISEIKELSLSELRKDAIIYIAELYRDIPSSILYGGTTKEALYSNNWIPISDDIECTKDNITINGIEGDTYYLRYDCLKTFPYTTEDTNQIVDICSFMVETKLNLDGRYDLNKDNLFNFNLNTTNFNLFNPVYNLNNNYFNYRILDDRFKLNTFPNTITWTKEKHILSDIDEWTNITMASTLDLDGDKGQITSLNIFNNELFCFLEKGLSNILFNSRVQISTLDGVPIEITNGLKVLGKRYISNMIGCLNKWSIVETSSGLYFMDNNTSSIYLFNGLLNSLTDKLGFKSWMNEVNNYSIWNPIDYSNFRSFYDRGNDDIYFINKDYCLCYSEYLQLFTSFMSYERVPLMVNIGSEFFSFKKNKLWRHNAGEYNMFYNEFKPYSITFVSNDNPSYDKIFNNLDFRADSFDNYGNVTNKTFNTLEVWNEYLKGSTNLNNIIGKPSTLKKKFRIWRVNIPRANTDWNGIVANNRDRIRNTWAYIKLSMNDSNNKLKTELHDVIVSYFM